MKPNDYKKDIHKLDKVLGSSSKKIEEKRGLKLAEKTEKHSRKTVEEIKKLQNIIPIDVRKELKAIKKAVENIEIPDKEKRLKAIEDLIIEIKNKNYDIELSDISELIKSIILPDNIDNTDRLVSAIQKEIRAIKQGDDSAVLDAINRQLKAFNKADKRTKTVKVANLPKIPKFNANPLIRAINKVGQFINDKTSVFVENESPEEAIPVILVDSSGKVKYNAQFNSSFPSSMSISNFPTEYDIYGFNGTNWHQIRIDSSTRSTCTIEYEHHEIHAGNSFYAEIFDATLSDTHTIIMLITTPNTLEYAHSRMMVQVTKATTVLFYEGTTVSAAGGAVTESNRERNSAHPATVVVTSKPTITANGTLLQTSYIGTGGKYGVGGTDSALNEWVLKANEKYMIILTSNEDNNKGIIGINWYEHTNETV